MKEILKYLRQTNSLTQDEIAKKINISRQWYIKFEKGLVQPTSKNCKYKLHKRHFGNIQKQQNRRPKN